MNVQQILNKARRLWYITKQVYDDVMWLEDLNEIYQDIVTTIIQRVNEDYFYNIYTTSLTAWINEYKFQEPTSSEDWMNKLKELYIKYWNEFKKARQIEESTMQESPEWYEVNQSPLYPLFKIADNSVFIYPKPSNIWELKASVTIIPQDLLITDTEDRIKLQRQHHNVLVFWLLVYIYQQRGMINEKNDALATYERLKNDLVMKLSDRDLSPLETSIPDLSYYE